MIIRALDGINDWMFGKGLSSYNYENNAILENIQTRIMSWLNDCWFDMEAGIDWPRLLGSKNTLTEIKLQVQAMILQSYGVIRLNEISAEFNGNTRNLVLTYNIDTIYSTSVEGGVTI